ncbi:SusC/RagA family TonB-linked outer membrane protein [Parapedobacter sp. 10938]|nr:SusC/RagA family TonB-linked outer membrane protein [Parapedobacter sp. 10938]
MMVICLLSSLPLFPQQNAEEKVTNQPLADSLWTSGQQINLVLGETSKEKTTGSVAYIDAEASLASDSRPGLANAIIGKVSGVFDAFNLWGTGPGVVVVDGIRQNEYYYQHMDIREIASIVVLKDAASKARYGAQGDQGIILINTKRGKAGEQKIRVTAEYSVSEPRALPNYLNAANYMEKFNEGQLNDGVSASSLRYSSRLIDSTHTSLNRAAYPDNDFYTHQYLRNFTSDMHVFADLTGGNENAQYYVNAAWMQSDGWLSMATTPDKTNKFNFRSNLDFNINRYLKMGIDAIAHFDFNERPRVGNYWNEFATILPNAYPVLWDPSIIADEEIREMVMTEARLIDGKVLGGNSSYVNNQIYGNLTQNGKTRYQQRNIQFGGKLELDLSFLTQGLAAEGYAGMNFYNSLFTQQNYDYAIYEPIFSELTGLVEDVNIHGVDRPSNRYNTNPGNSSSHRQVSYYGNLAYNRVFGKHDISAVALIYGDQITNVGELQRNTLFHTGLSATYMYANRYVIEGSAIGIGSRKLPENQRVELAPSVGLGWIMSGEDFMSHLSFLDYLKLRASYGVSKNDNWSIDGVDDYFLYRNTFGRGPGFRYYNGTHINPQTGYTTVENDIHMQKREDIVFGLDATMFNKAFNMEMSVFRSSSQGNMTLMANRYPSLLGYQNLVYSNYDSDRIQGIELGLNYTVGITRDLTAVLGGNLLHIAPKITRRSEPRYAGADRALQRASRPTDAMWGLVADGLYGEADFDLNGDLVGGLAVPSFGAVQPGDIKYLDQNNDGIIDQRDQRMIGHGLRTQYSVHLDLRYKNIGLYVLGVGKLGQSNYRSGSYFRVFGDVKFSEYAMQAYGPDNKDVNALHPRLSSNSGGHNDRNSSFWVYKNDTFILPTMQLTYHFKDKKLLKFLNQPKVYARASNLLVFGENIRYTEVNPGGPPRTRSVVFGFITSF